MNTPDKKVVGGLGDVRFDEGFYLNLPQKDHAGDRVQLEQLLPPLSNDSTKSEISDIIDSIVIKDIFASILETPFK